MHDGRDQVKLGYLKDALLAETDPRKRTEIRREIALVEALVRATREAGSHD